jgi:hypothetical protein
MLIKSSDVKNQVDYTITMNLIQKMLNKVTPIPTPGSILIGKKYAETYNEKINKMLETEYLNSQILYEMRKNVKQDLEMIIQDSNRRFYSYHIQENKDMMSMTLDFILSLP